MNKMIKKTIYFFIISLTFLLFFGWIGIYDTSEIQIDNFIIEKPFLYRVIGTEAKIKLSDRESKSFLFLHSFMTGGSVYSFDKIINKDRYAFESNYSLKLEKFDLSMCYIKKEIYKNLDDNEMYNINIYSYPYIVSFTEINTERENKLIKQVCGAKKHIFSRTQVPLGYAYKY